MVEHIKRTVARTSEVTGRLSRLLPNVGGPRSSKRRVMCGAVTSILMYGAPIWSRAMKYKKYVDMIARVQRRLALRICSAYRTVSLEAVQVLAGVVPLELLAEERTKINDETGIDKAELRARSVRKWQRRWSTLQGKAQWTHRLIPNIEDWVSRRHGEMSYWLTQFLTGHGCFKAYLHRFGRAENSECTNCAAPRDTAEHTVFECPRWETGRQKLQTELGLRVGPDNITQVMLMDPRKWETINSYIAHIIRGKESDEQGR